MFVHGLRLTTHSLNEDVMLCYVMLCYVIGLVRRVRTARKTAVETNADI